MLSRIFFIVSIPIALAISACGGSGDSNSDDSPTRVVTGSQDVYVESSKTSGLDGVVSYGRGSAFTDIDGDGYDDLFAVDTDSRHRPTDFGLSQMYLNNQDGTFSPIDVGISDADLVGAWVGSFADFDNDGDPDLVIGSGGYTTRSTLALYENQMNLSGQFVNITSAAGLTVLIPRIDDSHWWGAAWADYDNDGWLDLALTRREDSAILLHNNGDKTFSDVGGSLNIATSDMRDVKNPLWADFDEDGDQDLYLAGMVTHALYENRVSSNEGFVDRTSIIPFPSDVELAIGWQIPAYSPHPNVFAATTADFDQDGHEDLYLGRWDEQDYILFSHGDGSFTALGASLGIDALTDFDPGSGLPFENTMGLAIGDLFDDGYPDILIGTGDPETSGADIVFCNTRNRKFERCTDQFVDPDDQHLLTRGHGASFADIDKNGFVDVFWNLGGHPNFDLTSPGSDTRETNKHYARNTDKAASSAWIRLKGTSSNADAIGSRIEVVYKNGDKRYYFLHSTSAFQSQNSNELLIPMFGEADATLNIKWPNGQLSQHDILEHETQLIIQP